MVIVIEGMGRVGRRRNYRMCTEVVEADVYRMGMLLYGVVRRCVGVEIWSK